MLTHELVEALLTPIGEASPCGDDLEYDADFTALTTSAQGKPEQQFGDTVIPAVEPEWRQVAEQSDALLRRSKDVRPAVLLLRASTRLQGLAGSSPGSSCSPACSTNSGKAYIQSSMPTTTTTRPCA
jgi:type VI secretion system protein ImpA